MKKVWISNKRLVLGLTGLTILSLATIAYAGKGPTFHLFGSMQISQDPQNPANDVIILNTGSFPSSVIGAVTRAIPGKVQVQDLTNEISLKYYFVGSRTCVGGAPRIQIAVALNGGPKSDGNAFGYVGTQAFGGGCTQNAWTFNDLANPSDTVARWDLSQFGSQSPSPATVCTGSNTMTCTWAQVVTYFQTFSNHNVVQLVLADDSCSFAQFACGVSYYDLVTLGNRTLETSNDVEGH